MLTGRSFWLSADQTEMALPAFLRELVLDELPLASARATELGVTPPLPPGFDAWFARTLCRSRTERYPNATEAFAAFCQHLGIAAPSSTGPLPQVITGPMASEPTLPESRTDNARLASARTVPDPASGAVSQAAAPGAVEEGEPSTVPVEGLSPRLFAIGAAVAAVLVTVTVVVALRGRTSGAVPEPPDASAVTGSLPYCPKGMVRVPAGELVMGADDGPKEEQPAHAVKVLAFCIDATEVSVAEMKECVDRKGCSASPREQVDWESITAADRATWSTFCNAGRAGRADHPMNCVSFDDASAYCRWAGKKLPTEEQWEYAARGSDGRTYPWGSDVPSANRVNGCDDGCARAIRRPSDTIARRLSGDDHYEATSPTGALPEGVSAFGAFDMAGNVAEWVDAPFCSYGQSACGTATRVIRGGSWTSELPGDLRASARAKASPASRQADVGFRCVR